MIHSPPPSTTVAMMKAKRYFIVFFFFNTSITKKAVQHSPWRISHNQPTSSPDTGSSQLCTLAGVYSKTAPKQKLATAKEITDDVITAYLVFALGDCKFRAERAPYR